MPEKTSATKLTELISFQEASLARAMESGGQPIHLVMAMVLPMAREWLVSGDDRTAELDDLLDNLVALVAHLRSDHAPGLIIRSGVAGYGVDADSRVRRITAINWVPGENPDALRLEFGDRVRVPNLLDRDDALG